MGGMIAAEMAALAPYGYGKVVLIDPLGLWVDEHPIPDIYSLLPFEFPPMLFHDVAAGIELLAGGGVDFDDVEAIQRFLIGNNSPARHGRQDPLPDPQPAPVEAALPDHEPDAADLGRRRPPAAGAVRRGVVAGAPPRDVTTTIDGAGHLAPYEQPAAVAEAIAATLG